MSQSLRQRPLTARGAKVFTALLVSISVLASISLVSLNAGALGSKPVVTLESSQKYFGPYADFAHGKYLWVLDHDGGPKHNGAVYRIDLATGKTVAVFSSLFDNPLWLFSDGTNLWITNEYGGPNVNGSGGGSLLKLNIATSQLSKIVNKAIVGPSQMTSDGKYLWLLCSNSLLRMNIATGAITANKSVVTDAESAITSDKKYVWVGGTQLLRISKSTNTIKVIDAKRLTDIGSLISDGKDVWVRWGNRHLVELNIATGAVKSTYNPMFEFNEGLATNGHYVWMTDYYNRTVLQVDTSTGKVTEINSPLYSKWGTQSQVWAITSEGKHVWVTATCNPTAINVAKACGTVLKITP
jgi:DNA-binding beta-propeller fold protein YncE